MLVESFKISPPEVPGNSITRDFVPLRSTTLQLHLLIEPVGFSESVVF